MIPGRLFRAGALSLCGACLLAGAAWPAPERVTLLTAGPDLIVFEVEVPAASLDTLPGAPGMVRLGFEGHEIAGMPGTPGLPWRIVTVAVPPDGEVRVWAAGLGAETRDGLLLAPVPDLERSSEGTLTHYLRSDAAYSAAVPLAPERARLGGVAWVRNQRVAQIAIRPADYEPALRRLTTWRRVRVEVSVAGPAAATLPAERNDPFERLYADVLVNYEQGRAWRRPEDRVVPASARRAGLGALAQSVVPDTSVFVGREWVKLQVPRRGLYRLDYGTVRNLPLFQGASAPLASLRLFHWPGYPVLPEGSYCDSCDYREIPIGIEDDGDGLFRTNSDAIYFFALGPSDWANVYDPSWPDSSYINHPYESHNVYFLGFSTAAKPIAGVPRRIAPLVADADSTVPALQPATVPARVHYEAENEYYPNSPPLVYPTVNGSGAVDSLVWQKWFWTSVSPGPPRSVSFDLPGADTTQPVRVRFRAWGLTVSARGGFVRNRLDATLNGVALPRQVWDVKTSITVDTTLSSPRLAGNTLQLQNPQLADNAPSRIGLGFIEARFARRLAPEGDTITFEAPATGQRTLFRIGPFTGASRPWLFDITDAYDPRQVLGFDYIPGGGGTWQLVFAVDGLLPRRFTVFPNGGFESFPLGSVTAASRSSLANLRRLGTDYLVIYYDGFAAAAESLAAWRREHLPLSGVPAPYVTSTVPVSALYDQFSGGRTDPLAIRNFLRAAFYIGDTVATGGRRISHVTFLGDASYDFKNVYRKALPGQPACLIPTYENGYDASVYGGRKYTTDDWLTNVDDAEQVIPDLFSGRVPVGDAATAMDVVRNKVLFYERSTPLGEYRNRVMLIADDELQCNLPDPIRWGHVQQTTTADSLTIPNHVDRTYVYLHKYPRASAQSCLKPTARAAIQNAINGGIQLFNFVGHGSPFQLADEQVLIQTDVGTLVNGPRYPVVCTWSCDVNLFDDPLNQSLGERLMLAAGGGAIATLASTELAFSGLNSTLNQNVFRKLFERDPASGQYRSTLAEALLSGKVLGGLFALTNNIKYMVMGDAATRLNLPHQWVELALQDSAGAPLAQLPRGGLVRFTGRVLNAPGSAVVPLRGTASLVVEDSAPYEQVPEANQSVYYYYTPGAMYRGDVTIDNGVLSGAFVVPLESRLGNRGRIRAYVGGVGVPGRAVEDDGVGDLRIPVVAGSGVLPDSAGPAITLSFPGGATEVRPDASLEIRITDPSGILITDHVPQNGIIVTVDDNSTTRVDVTSSFRYEDGSYQSGVATFQLPNLALGSHRIEVSAADNLAAGFAGAAHRSKAAIDFQVVETPGVRVARAYLFPDPACSGCPDRGGQFLVDVPGDSVNVLLRLYTVSGRHIRTLESLGGLGRVQIPWDGLDAEHQPLANGVYLFRVNVNGREADGKSSARVHAVGDGRFVILNR